MRTATATATTTVPAAPVKPAPASPIPMLYHRRLSARVVVWARLAGFPWWPARLCTRGELLRALEPGAALPIAPPGAHHVWFFNDDDHVAVVPPADVAEYTADMHRIHLPDRWLDAYRAPVVQACREAHAWIASDRGARFQRRALPHVCAVVDAIAALPPRYAAGPWLPAWNGAEDDELLHAPGKKQRVKVRSLTVAPTAPPVATSTIAKGTERTSTQRG